MSRSFKKNTENQRKKNLEYRVDEVKERKYIQKKDEEKEKREFNQKWRDELLEEND